MPSPSTRLRFLLALGCLTAACDDDKTSPEPTPPADAGTGESDSGVHVRNELGAFTVELDGGIRVTANADPDHVVFELGEQFAALWAVDDTVTEQSGSFQIDEKVKSRCTEQGALEGKRTGDTLTLSSTLTCEGVSVPFTLTFTPQGERALGFELVATPPKGSALDQLVLTLPTVPDERFVGFGEQLSTVDQRGTAFPVVVQEGGIGRAKGTIADQIEAFSPGSGGTFYSTYAPMPFTFTSRGRSLLLENSELSQFDLTGDEAVTVRVRATSMRGRVFAGKTPREILTSLTEFTGRMPALPAWLGQGAVIGLQGGTERVREVLATLEAAKVEVAAFWLQDWVGKRDTAFGQRLWWNWQLNQTRYPEFATLVSDLTAKGIRVMTYVNPYLVDVAEEPETAAQFTRNLYAEARDAGYLVKDDEGAPYRHVSGTFAAGLVDLTNPSAVDWFKDVLRTEVLGIGVSGYMADFGEALAFDSVLSTGDPALEHNLWPERWAALNREVLEDEGLMGDAVFFSRSGYLKTPGLSTLFWAGDQTESWDEHDGMQSGLTALLSGGLSGISLNHTDIGGYTAFGDAKRSEELLLRWIEWSAFTAVFRSHEGNLPSVPQPYAGEAPLAHMARFSALFRALADYRATLMAEASENGAPLVRHLLFEYPDDTRAWTEGREFLLGPDVLVAPAFAEGVSEVTVYVPAGTWVPLFQGSEVEGPKELTVPSPLGEPAVFYRKGSAAGDALRGALDAAASNAR